MDASTIRIAFSCTICKKEFSVSSGYDFPRNPCCRHANRVSAILAVRVCELNRCGNYKPCPGGGHGCGILEKPGRIMNRFLVEATCLNDSRPEFVQCQTPVSSLVKTLSPLPQYVIDAIDNPPTFTQGSMDRLMVAVTSLSELPHHQTRQAECIASWQRFGLTVYSVNTADEIERLRAIYPEVDHWHESNEVTHESGSYDRPTQMIHTICCVSIQIDTPILIMNSDIEIIGQQSTLVERVKENSLVAGIRYNYGESLLGATREKYGIDAFLITPKMASTLPKLPLSIGRPVWDWWIPYHYRKEGYAMEFIGSPLFFHREHSLNWSPADWYRGRDWVNSHYGVNEAFGVDFRRTFPYPPPIETSQ